MRLIDADKLPFNTVGICDAQENFYGAAEVTFAEDIETAPTVDAVQVVRCKDCIYADYDNIEHDAIVCTRISLRGYETSNDFCSHGVRKGEKHGS